MHVEVARVPYEQTRRIGPRGETDAARASVSAARTIQQERCGVLNAYLEHRELLRVAALDSRAQALLGDAAERWNLSARSCDRILKVCRTIADLSGKRHISPANVAEAVQLRCLDRPL